jgi:sugar lactone lactonase YvrE
MNELIHGRMHDALDGEPTPAGLRVRVIASVPMPDRAQRSRRRPAFRWAGQWTMGFAAMVLAIAVILGLIYGRQTISSLSPGSGTHHGSAPRLVSPEGIAIARDGTVYLSDYVADRVFRLLPRGGMISVAGGGLGGDGRATEAWLNHPGALAVDSQGNLYIADNIGGTIRRVDRNGVISTVGSGYGPLGLAFDSGGVLYVGTYYGEIIGIDRSGGSTKLDLSALPPPLPQPGYMAFDSTGDLYVSDRAPVTAGTSPSPGGGCRILRLIPSQKHTQVESVWSIKVIAGTGTCGYSGDGGPAKSAQLDDPNGIVFDAAGNLYFADAGNHRIRRIDKNGIITTVAGTGVLGYSGDGGPATRAQLAYPFGMAITAGGLIYISDATCSCVDPVIPGHLRVLRLSDGIITTVPTG